MRMTRLALCLAVTWGATACGDAGDPAPEPKPTPAPEAPAPEAPTPPAPAPVEPAPAEPAGPGDVAAGGAQYQIYCATCHGATGCGDGPLSETLDPKPAKHCDGSYMNALSDEHLFRVVKEGGPAVGKSAQMAPWGGTLSDAQIRDVVAFMRSLAVPPYEASE